MTELHDFIRLQSWLSPAFPTGSFSYSHGLESAITNGWISEKKDLSSWFCDLLENGPGWNDAVLLAESWRAASGKKPLAEVAELATAMAFSSERHLETVEQGRAFLLAARAWGDLPSLSADCPLPVSVGAIAGSLGIDLEAVLVAFLHAYVSNQIQAALRLMKLGQQGGVEVLAELETRVLAVAHRASASTLDDLGSNTVLADIAAMQHETMVSRIFRS